MDTSERVKIFIAYARTDKDYLQELRKYIRPLERRESVDFWYDGEIKPGEVWEEKIKKHLHDADIVLLLVSANSIASNYFYDKEVADALERHKNKETVVIPIILKSCGWDLTPLHELQALPHNGLPINKWDRDSDAYTNITHELNDRINTIFYARQEAIKIKEDKIREEKEQRLLEETKAMEKAEREKRLKKESAVKRKEEEQRIKKETEAQAMAEQEKKREEESAAKRKEEEQRIKKETEAKETAAQTKNKEQKVANEKLVETNQFTSDKHNISESQSLLTIAENLFEKGMYRSALSKFEEAKIFDPNNANIDARITITRDKLNKSQKSTPNEMAKIVGGLFIAVIIFIILYGIFIAIMQGW